MPRFRGCSDRAARGCGVRGEGRVRSVEAALLPRACRLCSRSNRARESCCRSARRTKDAGPEARSGRGAPLPRPHRPRAGRGPGAAAKRSTTSGTGRARRTRGALTVVGRRTTSRLAGGRRGRCRRRGGGCGGRLGRALRCGNRGRGGRGGLGCASRRRSAGRRSGSGGSGRRRSGGRVGRRVLALAVEQANQSDQPVHRGVGEVTEPRHRSAAPLDGAAHVVVERVLLPEGVREIRRSQRSALGAVPLAGDAVTGHTILTPGGQDHIGDAVLGEG